MKFIRLLSLSLIGSALTLSACAKDDQAGTSGAATAGGTTNPGDGDGDDDDETGNTGVPTFGDGDGDDPGDGDGDMGFVPMDDDIPGIAECDPWAQDCPMGEKCVAYGSTGGNWDANRCVPITGEGQSGDPCSYDGTSLGSDDCGAGLMCWNVNEEGVGACTDQCTGSPDDPICDPDHSCSIANEGSIILCLLSCDPLLQDCPSASNSCFYDFSGGFVCAFFTQNLPAGEPCGFINDCIGGAVCLDATVFPDCAGSSCCAEFCDLTDPTCTLAGTECEPFFEEGTAPPGYEDVGVCIVPGA